MKRFNQFFTILLVPLDYLMLVASFLSAYWLRLNWQFIEVIYIQPWDSYLQFALYASVIWVVVFAMLGLYRFRGFKNHWELFGRVIIATSTALALFMIGLFLIQTTFFSRLIIIYVWGMSLIFVVVGRAFLEVIKQWFQNYGIGVERVIIIGHGKIGEVLRDQVKQNRPKQKLVHYFSYLDTEELSRYSKADRIIISYEPPAEEMSSLIRFAEDNNITLQYVPSLPGLYASHISVDMLSGYPLIELIPTLLTGWGRIVKRIFDIVLVLLSMIIALPIMGLVAIAIKLDSKGPVIFAQERVGELGKTFTFYKFRSMYTEMSTGEGYGGREAEELRAKLKAERNEAKGPLFKIKDDPRVTRVGKFIRKTSLDELPQLFNVLIGNMSLVGPRPALPEEVREYSDDLKRRLLVKPGVTGLWQVSGRHDSDEDEYGKLDVFYIEHWSLWLDIKIILLTFKTVLSRKGSY